MLEVYSSVVSCIPDSIHTTVKNFTPTRTEGLIYISDRICLANPRCKIDHVIILFCLQALWWTWTPPTPTQRPRPPPPPPPPLAARTCGETLTPCLLSEGRLPHPPGPPCPTLPLLPLPSSVSVKFMQRFLRHSVPRSGVPYLSLPSRVTPAITLTRLPPLHSPPLPSPASQLFNFGPLSRSPPPFFSFYCIFYFHVWVFILNS